MKVASGDRPQNAGDQFSSLVAETTLLSAMWCAVNKTGRWMRWRCEERKSKYLVHEPVDAHRRYVFCSFCMNPCLPAYLPACLPGVRLISTLVVPHVLVLDVSLSIAHGSLTRSCQAFCEPGMLWAMGARIFC